MKRYDRRYHDENMHEYDDGTWVSHADHVSAIGAANQERDWAVVEARRRGALAVMGLLVEWSQKLGGSISLGLTINEATGQPIGATLDVFHGKGEKYGALVTGLDEDKIVPADTLPAYIAVSKAAKDLRAAMVPTQGTFEERFKAASYDVGRFKDAIAKLDDALRILEETP